MTGAGVDKRGPRGPYAKSAARRTSLLLAARDSFAERGYAGSSLRDIAQRAGMTHAGLLHHFASKDELLLGVLAHRDEQEQQRSGADEGTADARTFLGTLLREYQERPELVRLWAELTVSASRREHVAHDHFVTRYAQARQLTAAYFRELAARGRLRSEVDPQAAAALLLAVLDGLQTQWLLDHEQDIVGSLDAFFDLVLVPEPGGGAVDGPPAAS